VTAGTGGVAVPVDRLVLISDLHLGGGAEAAAAGSRFTDPADGDEALIEFLAHLRRRPDVHRHRLVLLGDTLDFLRVPVTGRRAGLYARNDAEAVGQLERIHTAHSRVFGGLADLLAVAAGVDLVAGNHDIELTRPAVRARLRSLLRDRHGCRPRALAALRFHPWGYHAPGLLYAEHGNHYHDINTFERPLQPFRRKGLVERPPAARLGGIRRLAAGPVSSVGLRDGVADLLPRLRPDSAARSAYACLLDEYADELGLDADVVRRLHTMGEASALRIARRLLRSRLAGGPTYAEQLPEIAAAVHRVLSSRGQGVRFYVFGHVHVPQYRRLPGTGASYLNTGTWSTDGTTRHTWVEITTGRTGSPTAALLRWMGGPLELSGPNDGRTGEPKETDVC
jgi:UDP-2,3-diacylglucosamine pyrophosphatase LpxH